MMNGLFLYSVIMLATLLYKPERSSVSTLLRSGDRQKKWLNKSLFLSFLKCIVTQM